MALLGLALCMGVGMLCFRERLSDGAFVAVFVAANLMIAAAILIDTVKLRRLRENYQKGLAAAAKSKAARAEQKRVRAMERECGKACSAEGRGEPVDEASMTFRERVAFRARMSAQAANTKGSGL